MESFFLLEVEWAEVALASLNSLAAVLKRCICCGSVRAIDYNDANRTCLLKSRYKSRKLFHRREQFFLPYEDMVGGWSGVFEFEVICAQRAHFLWKRQSPPYSCIHITYLCKIYSSSMKLPPCG